MKGAYILVIKLSNNQKIQIGKLGKIFFKKGFYVYIGSSMNNLEKRINRHLNEDKKFHWHIDYLLKIAIILEIYLKKNTIKEECKIVNIFYKEKIEKVIGFGCSDCNCKSHLFYGKKDDILNLISKIGMIKYKRQS
jgi:Uri superfamily endonuclease